MNNNSVHKRGTVISSKTVYLPERTIQKGCLSFPKLSYAMLLAGLTAFTVSSNAADVTWNGSQSNDWFDGANWDGGSRPLSADNAYINNGSIEIDRYYAQTRFMYLGNEPDSNATLTVKNEITWENFSTVYVGYSGIGNLNITNGARSYTYGTYIGYNAGSSGKVVIDGTNSKWEIYNNNPLQVGVWGSGEVSLRNGGSLLATFGLSARIGKEAGSTGTINVDGAGSLWKNNGWLYLGDAGTGTLNVSKGGSSINATVFVGNQENAIGNATVDGSGSSWTADYGYIGNYGKGTTVIRNGGYASISSCYLAYYAGSEGNVTVSGVGSKLNANYYLYVGYEGSGTLDIKDGGSVAVQMESYIGVVANSNGTVTVSGVGSQLETVKMITIGSRGNGTLNISGGGTVVAKMTLIGAWNIAGEASGFATVDGAGSLLSSEEVTVGRYSGGQGVLNITNGGAVVSTYAFISDGNYNSKAVVTIDGSNSRWESGSMDIGLGSGGEGTLTVSNSGTVKSSTYVSTSSKSRINIGASADKAAVSAGIINAPVVNGYGTLQFNHTATKDNAYYFTNNGTNSGVAVNTSGSMQIIHTSGVTVLTGSYAHTGGTTINGGNLVLAEGSALAGNVIVNTSAKLSGLGTASGNVVINDGGTLLMEDHGSSGFRLFSVSGLTINNLTLNNGSILDFQGGLLTVNGILTVNSGDVIMVNLHDYTDGDTITLMTFGDLSSQSGITMDTDANTLFTLNGGYSYNGVFNFRNDGGVYSLVYGETIPTPEPTTGSLFLGTLALGGAFICRRNRRRM